MNTKTTNMNTTTVAITDPMPEILLRMHEGLREYLLRHLNKTRPDECPTFADVNEAEGIGAFVESLVPDDAEEIKRAWFFHGDDLLDLYYGAFWTQLCEEMHRWWADSAKDIFGEWQRIQKGKSPEN